MEMLQPASGNALVTAQMKVPSLVRFLRCTSPASVTAVSFRPSERRLGKARRCSSPTSVTSVPFRPKAAKLGNARRCASPASVTFGLPPIIVYAAEVDLDQLPLFEREIFSCGNFHELTSRVDPDLTADGQHPLSSLPFISNHLSRFGYRRAILVRTRKLRCRVRSLPAAPSPSVAAMR